MFNISIPVQFKHSIKIKILLYRKIKKNIIKEKQHNKSPILRNALKLWKIIIIMRYDWTCNKKSNHSNIWQTNYETTEIIIKKSRETHKIILKKNQSIKIFVVLMFLR